MPSLHERKTYKRDSIYHVYNRGNNKQETFFSSFDYYIFRNIANTTIKDLKKTGIEIEIYAFALMPNHFHLILWQKNEMDMSHFMRVLTLRYVIYVNKSYSRTGNLFYRPYRARLLKSPKDVAAAIQYVLNNPQKAGYSNWKHLGTKI